MGGSLIKTPGSPVRYAGIHSGPPSFLRRKKMEKRYLGDGLSVEFDGFHVVLTTSNGRDTTNRICLDPDVLGAFELWLTHARLKAQTRKRKIELENQNDSEDMPSL